ncbi:MarR family transcriptional regulator [Bacillus thuringiensis serovar thailandensis]|nr:MarR family transcriptional regulator [Bacillus thuringiensis serovar thailandensis]
MKQNIGTINALIRITLGFVLFGCSATKLVRKPWCTWSNILLWIGAMKVAEGIVRFCPIVEMWKFGKYMNMGAFKMPSMDFAKKGHTKEEANQTSNHDKPQSNGSYDASDKEIESAIEDIILAKPL